MTHLTFGGTQVGCIGLKSNPNTSALGYLSPTTTISFLLFLTPPHCNSTYSQSPKSLSLSLNPLYAADSPPEAHRSTSHPSPLASWHEAYPRGSARPRHWAADTGHGGSGGSGGRSRRCARECWSLWTWTRSVCLCLRGRRFLRCRSHWRRIPRPRRCRLLQLWHCRVIDRRFGRGRDSLDWFLQIFVSYMHSDRNCDPC